VIHIHLGLDQCFAAFQMVYQDKAGVVEVAEFFGRDERLVHLSFACAEMLSSRAPGNSKRVAAFAQLLAIYIAERRSSFVSSTSIAQRFSWRRCSFVVPGIGTILGFLRVAQASAI
jgi:hypothetical protein